MLVDFSNMGETIYHACYMYTVPMPSPPSLPRCPAWKLHWRLATACTGRALATYDVGGCLLWPGSPLPRTPWRAQASCRGRTTPTLSTAAAAPLVTNKRDGDADHVGPLLVVRRGDQLYQLVLNNIRFESLTDKRKLDAYPKLSHFVPDKATNALTLTNSDIGMTKSDLVNNLCTIPRSRTKEFMDALSTGADVSMIGQSGPPLHLILV